MKMTASLKLLEHTRQGRLEDEVEDEFRLIQEKKLLEKKGAHPVAKKKSAKAEWDQILGGDGDEEE